MAKLSMKIFWISNLLVSTTMSRMQKVVELKTGRTPHYFLKNLLPSEISGVFFFAGKKTHFQVKRYSDFPYSSHQFSRQHVNSHTHHV